MQIKGLELYPFGSRTKLNKYAVRSNSDYDYAAQYSQEAKAILEAQGFKPAFDSEYFCKNLTVMVYEKDNVDIVLKSDLERFKEGWESISPEFFQYFIWKHSPLYMNMPEDERSFFIARAIEQFFRV